jgi:exosome complex RNA-binding protein Csl4
MITRFDTCKYGIISAKCAKCFASLCDAETTIAANKNQQNFI